MLATPMYNANIAFQLTSLNVTSMLAMVIRKLNSKLLYCCMAAAMVACCCVSASAAAY